MDNKRYYWIKLKTDFFNQETMDFLLSQKNGCEYIVLYQMLCLNTANSNGRLESKIGEMIVPYNADKIVRDCKYFDIDTVNIAMALYKRLGLIYEEEDSVLKISNYEDMVGSVYTDEHYKENNRLRQQRFREKQKLLKNSNVMLTENITLNNNVENRDKSIDIRDIDIKKENIKERKIFCKEIIDELIKDEEVKEAIYEFIKMRKLIKKPLTERALKQLINKLLTLSSVKEEQLQILDNSIINNWSNVYPLKKQTVIRNDYVRQEATPDWYGKRIKIQEALVEEQEEMKKILKEMKRN